MSLKRNCDGCGAVMQDGIEQRDYPELAVYIGDSETPAYEYEDLCPKCRDRLICAIENALVDCDVAAQPVPEAKSSDTAPERGDTAIRDDTAEPESPSPVPDPADGDGYANGVVRQFPVKSVRVNH